MQSTQVVKSRDVFFSRLLVNACRLLVVYLPALPTHPDVLVYAVDHVADMTLPCLRALAPCVPRSGGAMRPTVRAGARSSSGPRAPGWPTRSPTAADRKG